MSVHSLPTEILQKIFGYCRQRDLKPISQVCHRWNDAVAYLLLPQTCLKVSYAIRNATKTKLLNKGILRASNRQYTCFRVELPNGAPDWIKLNLNRLLDVCQKRFKIEQLHLRGSPNKTLVQLFNDRHEWFRNLTFLQVHLYPAVLSEAAVGGMVTLPNLKRLIWIEDIQALPRTYQRGRNALRSKSDRNQRDFPSWSAFALNVPKLVFLTVYLRDTTARDQLRSGRQDPDVCSLFLPTLELKPGSDLRELCLTSLLNLNQCYIDGSERILQNLELLLFNYCHSDVIVRICDKCSNLKELVVKNPLEGSMPLQVSATLSANLQKLRISVDRKDTPFALYGTAVFPKLWFLFFNQITFEMDQRVCLDAPQLRTCNLFAMHLSQSILSHTAQIRSMVLQVARWNNHDLHPPPSVTELGLYKSTCCRACYGTEARLIGNYLECVPYLTRLKMTFAKLSSFSDELAMIDLSFVASLPELEHLTICQAGIRLVECAKLVGLKSLLLIDCNIVADPSDETVTLTALEYFRAERVTMHDNNRRVFPFQLNARQPPIEIVSVSASGRNVFNSINFTTEWDEFLFLLETQY